MFKLSKLADYAVVLLANIAAKPAELWNAKTLSELTHIPQPTVVKLMKILAKSNLLLSERGTHGGYRLSRPPEEVSLLDVIHAADGPVTLTSCAKMDGQCDFEASCCVKQNWRKISFVLTSLLAKISIRDMVSDLKLESFTQGASVPKGMCTNTELVGLKNLRKDEL